MGLYNILATKYGAPAIMDFIKEKDISLYEFIDKLDECSLPEAFAKFLEKRSEMLLIQSANKKIEINLKPINWMLYSQRFLTEKPALNVIVDLLNELGFSEVFDINLKDVLKSMTDIKK